jgi:hypothetical protein
MKLFHPAALDGGIKLLTCVTLEYIAEAVLDDAPDPHTVLGGPRVFQVWGRN